MTEPTTATVLPFVTPARPQAVALASNELHAMATSKLADALTPGFQAEFSPFEAQLAGAFLEDALPEADAMESTLDLLRAIQAAPAQQP